MRSEVTSSDLLDCENERRMQPYTRTFSEGKEAHTCSTKPHIFTSLRDTSSRWCDSQGPQSQHHKCVFASLSDPILLALQQPLYSAFHTHGAPSDSSQCCHIPHELLQCRIFHCEAHSLVNFQCLYVISGCILKFG
jgi:hypothetical protein